MYNYVLFYEEFNKYEKRRNLNYPKKYLEKDFKYIMDTICTDVKGNLLKIKITKDIV